MIALTFFYGWTMLFGFKFLSKLKSFALQIIYPVHRKIKMIGLPGSVKAEDLWSPLGLLEPLRQGFRGLWRKYQETMRARLAVWSKLPCLSCPISLFSCSVSALPAWLIRTARKMLMAFMQWQCPGRFVSAPQGREWERAKQPGLCILEMKLNKHNNVFNL